MVYFYPVFHVFQKVLRVIACRFSQAQFPQGKGYTIAAR